MGRPGEGLSQPEGNIIFTICSQSIDTIWRNRLARHAQNRTIGSGVEGGRFSFAGTVRGWWSGSDQLTIPEVAANVMEAKLWNRVAASL